MTNAVRHSEAKSLTVTIEAGDELIISVVDDGVGVPEDVARSGLLNLDHRARQFGGSLSVTWRVPH